MGLKVEGGAVTGDADGLEEVGAKEVGRGVIGCNVGEEVTGRLVGLPVTGLDVGAEVCLMIHWPLP